MIRKIARVFAYLFVFSIPWENALVVGESSITRTIGIGAAGVWILSLFFEKKIRKPHRMYFFALLFVIWNLMNVYWTKDMDITIQRIKTYTQLILFSFVIWDMVNTPREFRTVMQFFVLGSYVSIFSLFVNFFNDQEAYAYSSRFTGAQLNANDLGVILAMSLPMAWFLIIGNGKPKINVQSLVNILFIPAAFVAIILTGSRTALLVSIPFALYLTYTLLHSNPKVLVAVLSVQLVLFLVVFPLVPTATLQRLGTIGDSISEADLGGRVGLWYRSLESFTHHPLLGTGSGSNKSVIGAVSHNTFISVLSEQGVIGFSIFVLFLLSALTALLEKRNEFSGLMAVVLLIWFLSVNTLTWEYHKVTWLLMTFTIIAMNIQPEAEKEAEKVIPGGKQAQANLPFQNSKA